MGVYNPVNKGVTLCDGGEGKMINRDRLVKTFCELVKIDSPSGEEEAIAQHLSEHLEKMGFTVTRDKHGNLIASEEGHNPLLLSAHMDTVEPGRGVKPRILDDRITSDGTTVLGGDCKAGIAAILEALESIREEGVKRVPVQLVFTRGEEIGLVGARNLDFSRVRAKEGVVFDGGGPVTKVTMATPTYIRFDVHIKGRAAHAGVEPEKGLSAIKIAAEVIAQLPQGRLNDETTFNVGTIKGGSVRNAVPEEAAFSGEFRSHDTEALTLLRKGLLDTLDAAHKKYPDAEIKEQLDTEFQMYSLTKDDPLVRRVTDVLIDLGLKPELGPSGGGTDANVFNEHGTLCVVVGMSAQLMHTVREFVPIKDLVNAARFCEALLKAR